MPSTNSTFKASAFGSTSGVQTLFQQLSVEVLGTDPTNISTTYPRIWMNTTTKLIKYTTDGVLVKTVATV